MVESVAEKITKGNVTVTANLARVAGKPAQDEN